MLTILTAFVVLITIYIWRYYENVKRYPKGPTPLPIIGNLHTIDWKKAHLQFSELSKVYGPVFTVWLPRPHVCVMDYEHIREAFHVKGDDFSGRGKILPDTAFQTMENGGVIFSDGEEWKEQRRASLHILRDFGMGKNVMEEQVAASMQDCLKHIDSLKDSFEAVDLRWPMQLYVGNVITHTLYGYRYPYTDFGRLQHFADCLNDQMAEKKKSKVVMLSQIWPWINSIPFLSYSEKARKNIEPIHDIVKFDIDNAMKTYDPSQEPECFIHAYKRKMEQNEALSDSQLVNVALDFYIAGMETTSTTMRWAILFMATHPKIQEKLRNEILQVVGFDRMVTMNDKSQLPYTSAFINEVQRCANLVPLNVTHRTVKDTSVGKYEVPADTMIFGVLSNVLLNSSVYPNGEKFDPERFLMEDGKTARKEAVDQLIPFSIGKRQCAGEALARMELFLGVVSLVQHYKFEPRPGQEIDLEPIYASVLLPKHQLIKITPVHQ